MDDERLAFIDSDRTMDTDQENDEENSTTPMLPELENCDLDDERISRASSTRSCPESLASKAASRAAASRRSLKETGSGIGRRLGPLVHKALPGGLERISEDFVSTVEVEDKDNDNPVAPPRPSRLSRLSQDPETPRDIVSPTQSEKSVAERIEAALNHNYYVIAYSIIIIAYLIGFTEYLYLRLVSLLAPDHTFHHMPCADKQNRRVGKDGFHYGVSIAAFLAIALFQLICFFGLTISENWTTTHGENVEPRREQLAASIRGLISKTMYRVFFCYGLCSFINCSIIFYMVGIQDSLGDTVSTVFLYVFDAVVILYFIAFPLTTIVYHPNVHCFKKKSANPPPQLAPPRLPIQARSQSSTLESTISGLEEYVQSPRRLPRTTTVV